MTLDPTWGEKFDNFGKSDLDHVAFAVWGGTDQEPGAVMHGQTDTGYQYEDTTLDYHAGVSAPVGTAAITATRYVALPFIALDRITVRAVPQTASDNNTVGIGSLRLSLGSLAPSQVVSFFHVVWGAQSWQGGPIQFLSGTGTGQTVLATANIRVSWVAALGLLGLILASGLIWFVLRLRARKQEAGAPLPVDPAQPTTQP